MEITFSSTRSFVCAIPRRRKTPCRKHFSQLLRLTRSLRAEVRNGPGWWESLNTKSPTIFGELRAKHQLEKEKMMGPSMPSSLPEQMDGIITGIPTTPRRTGMPRRPNFWSRETFGEFSAIACRRFHNAQPVLLLLEKS